jgi:hypothetical protein
LVDPDELVRHEAIIAAGKIKNPELLSLVINNLQINKSRSATMEALAEYGEMILPIVEKAIQNDGFEPADNTIRLVRVCRQIKGDNVQSLMVNNIHHPSPVLRDQVLLVLLTCGYKGSDEDLPTLNTALYQEANRVFRLLVVRGDVDKDPSTEPLHQEFDDEINQARRRIFWLLAFMYEKGPILNAMKWLEQSRGPEPALAMEMLDVTLSSEHRSLVLPLIDPALDPLDRIQALNKHFKAKHINQGERLVEIITNQGGLWYAPYSRACALFAATKLDMRELVSSIESCLLASDPTLRETAVWALATLSPDMFTRHASELSTDKDLQVKRVVASLRDKRE